MASMMDKAVAHIVLDHPFFASVLLRHPIKPSRAIPTLSVSYKGEISYNPEFFDTLPVNQAVFDLCHEVLHYMSKHALRQGHREHEDWNKACDAWINGMLIAMKIGEPNPGIFTMYQAETKTEETLYDILVKEKEDKRKEGEKPQGTPGEDEGEDEKPQGAPGEGDAPPPPNPDPLADDVEPPPPGLTESEKSEQEATVNLEVAEAGQSAKMRDALPGLLQKFVADTTTSKVPWFEELERFMVDKAANDYSWARPNRRYMPDFYLPTLNSVGSMGEMAVQVDISGSVSRKELEYYNGHLARIIELCSPSKVHVIYTDTRVQRHEEFERGEEFKIDFYSGGGTDMRAGFEYLAEKGIDVSCLVTLTDGYTPFPTAGQFDVPDIWCISSKTIKSPTGHTIPFDMND